jgi:hypothetical protein
VDLAPATRQPAVGGATLARPARVLVFLVFFFAEKYPIGSHVIYRISDEKSRVVSDRFPIPSDITLTVFVFVSEKKKSKFISESDKF